MSAACIAPAPLVGVNCEYKGCHKRCHKDCSNIFYVMLSVRWSRDFETVLGGTRHGAYPKVRSLEALRLERIPRALSLSPLFTPNHHPTSPLFTGVPYFSSLGQSLSVFARQNLLFLQQNPAFYDLLIVTHVTLNRTPGLWFLRRLVCSRSRRGVCYPNPTFSNT